MLNLVPSYIATAGITAALIKTIRRNGSIDVSEAFIRVIEGTDLLPVEVRQSLCTFNNYANYSYRYQDCLRLYLLQLLLIIYTT